jgi:hypothetical protein
MAWEGKVWLFFKTDWWDFLIFQKLFWQCGMGIFFLFFFCDMMI